MRAAGPWWALGQSTESPLSLEYGRALAWWSKGPGVAGILGPKCRGSLRAQLGAQVHRRA